MRRLSEKNNAGNETGSAWHMLPRRVRLSLHPHIAQEVYMQQDLIQVSAIPYAALLLFFPPYYYYYYYCYYHSS